jgi:hypothetical protein
MQEGCEGLKKLSLFWLAAVPFVVAVSSSDPPVVPVPAVCPSLADGARRIAGLQTGQALSNGGTTTLQFSSEVLSCGEWTNEVKGDECLDRWSFHIAVPSEALVPGVHRLAPIGATFGDLFVTTSLNPNPGCSHACDTSVKGVGSISVEASEATLIIDSADDGCITGRISGLVDSRFVDAPNFDGAFFAVRCSP